MRIPTTSVRRLAAGLTTALIAALGGVPAARAALPDRVVMGAHEPTLRIPGLGVKPVGDVNGDGHPDLAVPGRGAAAHVVFGPFAPTGSFDPAGAPGMRFDPPADAPSWLGLPVNGVGDVNGDGRDDLAVGSGYLDAHGRSHAGRSWIVFGSAEPTTVDLDAVGARGIAVAGPAADAWVWPGERAGDLDGDGFADVAFVDSRRDGTDRPDAGSVHVLYGSRQPADVDLAAGAPLRIDGARSADQIGTGGVAPADMDGDGADDLVIGAPFADGDPLTSPRDAGAVYVVPGSRTRRTGRLDLAGLNVPVIGWTGLRIVGPRQLAYLSRDRTSLATAGDTDGDDLEDLVIGDPTANPAGRYHAGQAFLVHGRDDLSGTLDLAAPPAGAVTAVIGASAWDFVGAHVAGGDDVDGDGLDDVLVGSNTVDAAFDRHGAAYLVRGVHDRRKVVDLAAAGGAAMVLEGPAPWDETASTLAMPGDLGRDGHPELLIGRYGVRRTDAVGFHVTPPDCSGLSASPAVLTQPDGTFRTVMVGGATDPDRLPVTHRVTAVVQDEPLGDTAPDARRADRADAVELRAERAGGGDGRVYRLAVTASNPLGGSCSATVTVGVPHDASGRRPVVDSGGAYDAFGGT